MTTWLIDTALFKTLAPGTSRGLRAWLETYDDPIFLSAASLVETQAAIARLARGQAQRADASRHWLDVIVSGFGDRIHPVDAEIAIQRDRYCHIVKAVTSDIDFMTRRRSRPRKPAPTAF